MERMKRPHIDTILDYNNNNIKKPKLQAVPEKSLFEDLANETVYEILDYLDIYHAHEAFFNLNTRFRNLFLHSNLPIQVNISTMSKSTFERYHKNVIVPNKHRINYLRLSNPFTVGVVFSPPRIISEFVQLETLVLDHINAKNLRNILTHAVRLRQLHSLVLNLVEEIPDPAKLFNYIFRLPKLNRCQITYQTKENQDAPTLSSGEYTRSPIEHLVINGRVPYSSLDSLLFRLPKLRHLSINTVVGEHFFHVDPEFIPVKHLKHISLKFEDVKLNQLEILIKNFFRHVEILRLTTRHDQAYLDAQRWEQIIVSHMPKLRLFDLKHTSGLQNDPLSYHHLMDRFNSPFWIERGWFFTHQHTCQRSLDSGVFYSTEPYRRKDYTFYWELDKQRCPHLHETKLNSVREVHIGGKEATSSSVNYFPKATELTIQFYFQTPDDSVMTTLSCIVPLKQLTKLIVQCSSFPLEEMMKLLRCTSNLHTLEFRFQWVAEVTLETIRKSEIYQYVSTTNRIKTLKLGLLYHLREVSFIRQLFPQMDHLETRINRKEILPIMRQLLTKTANQTCHLFSICINRLPKICLKELNILFTREKLLDAYRMKFINRDLYLWW